MDFILFLILVLAALFAIRIHLLEVRVKKLERAVKPPPSRLRFYIIKDGQKVEVKNMDVPADKKLLVNLEEDDVLGDVVSLPTAPSWSITDPSIGALVVAADGLSAIMTPAKMGACQIQASVVNAAGVTLAASMDVNVLPGDAVSLKLSGTLQ